MYSSDIQRGDIAFFPVYPLMRQSMLLNPTIRPDMQSPDAVDILRTLALLCSHEPCQVTDRPCYPGRPLLCSLLHP